jgi:hypothetical protein
MPVLLELVPLDSAFLLTVEKLMGELNSELFAFLYSFFEKKLASE